MNRPQIREQNQKPAEPRSASESGTGRRLSATPAAETFNMARKLKGLMEHYGLQGLQDQHEGRGRRGAMSGRAGEQGPVDGTAATQGLLAGGVVGQTRVQIQAQAPVPASSMQTQPQTQSQVRPQRGQKTPSGQQKQPTQQQQPPAIQQTQPLSSSQEHLSLDSSRQAYKEHTHAATPPVPVRKISIAATPPPVVKLSSSASSSSSSSSRGVPQIQVSLPSSSRGFRCPDSPVGTYAESSQTQDSAAKPLEPPVNMAPLEPPVNMAPLEPPVNMASDSARIMSTLEPVLVQVHNSLSEKLDRNLATLFTNTTREHSELATIVTHDHIQLAAAIQYLIDGVSKLEGLVASRNMNVYEFQLPPVIVPGQTNQNAEESVAHGISSMQEQIDELREKVTQLEKENRSLQLENDVWLQVEQDSERRRIASEDKIRNLEAEVGEIKEELAVFRGLMRSLTGANAVEDGSAHAGTYGRRHDARTLMERWITSMTRDMEELSFNRNAQTTPGTSPSSSEAPSSGSRYRGKRESNAKSDTTSGPVTTAVAVGGNGNEPVQSQERNSQPTKKVDDSDTTATPGPSSAVSDATSFTTGPTTIPSSSTAAPTTTASSSTAGPSTTSSSRACPGDRFPVLNNFCLPPLSPYTPTASAHSSGFSGLPSDLPSTLPFFFPMCTASVDACDGENSAKCSCEHCVRVRVKHAVEATLNRNRQSYPASVENPNGAVKVGCGSDGDLNVGRTRGFGYPFVDDEDEDDEGEGR